MTLNHSKSIKTIASLLCMSYKVGIQVIVITWARVIEIYTRARGCAAPKCLYERQITSAHVITNISHCPCGLIAYYGWPKAVQATLNLLSRLTVVSREAKRGQSDRQKQNVRQATVCLLHE